MMEIGFVCENKEQAMRLCEVVMRFFFEMEDAQERDLNERARR